MSANERLREDRITALPMEQDRCPIRRLEIQCLTSKESFVAVVGRLRNGRERQELCSRSLFSETRLGYAQFKLDNPAEASLNASGYLPFLLTSEREPLVPSGNHADRRSLVLILHTSVWVICCRPPDLPISYTVSTLAFLPILKLIHSSQRTLPLLQTPQPTPTQLPTSSLTSQPTP